MAKVSLFKEQWLHSKKREKMKKKYHNKLNLKTLWATVFPTHYNRWKYMGYGFNIFDEGTEGYEYIEAFFRYVDSKLRPRWCPKTLLRLLHLIGNDNSIVRVRWWWAHNLHKKITNGIMITDVKSKWGTLRVYGYFTDEIYTALDDLEKKVDPLIEIY